MTKKTSNRSITFGISPVAVGEMFSADLWEWIININAMNWARSERSRHWRQRCKILCEACATWRGAVEGQRGSTGARAAGDTAPEIITQTFMHEGITKCYRCYTVLIEADLFIATFNSLIDHYNTLYTISVMLRPRAVRIRVFRFVTLFTALCWCGQKSMQTKYIPSFSVLSIFYS